MLIDFKRIREELSTPEGRDAFRRKWELDMAAKAKTLDFTNVKERNFNIKHLPDGDYAARITKVEETPSKKSGEPMWLFTFSLTRSSVPGAKGASYPYYCLLNQDNLWKIRNLWAAAGVNIPKKRVAIDPNKVIGKEVGLTLGTDEYEGKMKSVIEQVLPLSEIDEMVAEDDEDDEAAAPAAAENGKAKKDKKKKKAKPAADEDDELEELEVEEI